MSRYKVHIDKPLPDKAQIAKFKNFDDLHARYQTHTRFQVWQNLYRNPKAFAALVAIVAVIFLVVNPGTEPDNPMVPSLSLSGQEMAYQQTTLQNEAGGTWILNETESIEIPAYAFVDSQGEAVTGPIEVRWTSLEDPAAIFLHGPTGNQPLERLMQLTAFQDGKALSLKQGASVHWSLPTDQTEGTWMAWDDSTSRWTRGAIEVSDAPIAVATAPVPSEELLALRAANRDDAGAKALPVMPQRPERPFGVKLKRPEAHPEFRDYAQTYWTYVPGAGSNDPWAAGLVGADRPPQEVRIQKLATNQYRLQFVRMDESGDMEIIPVLASPVFEAKSSADAQRSYRQQLSKWERDRNQVEKELSDRAQLKADWEAAEAAFAAEKRAFENQSDSTVIPRSQLRLAQAVSAIATNTQADSFAIRFEADSLPRHIWALDQHGTSLIPLRWEEGTAFNSPQSAESLQVFWAVADSQSIWIATPTKVKTDKGTSSIELKVNRQRVNSYEEALGVLRRYLPETPKQNAAE